MAVFFKRYENRSTQRKTSLKGQEPTTNPQMMPPRLEARPHWWQVIAPPTAPRLLFTCNQCSKSAVRLQKQLHLKLKGDSIHRLLNCGHSHREILCKVAQPWPSQVSSFRYIWYLVRKKKTAKVITLPSNQLAGKLSWGSLGYGQSALEELARTLPSNASLLSNVKIIRDCSQSKTFRQGLQVREQNKRCSNQKIFIHHSRSGFLNINRLVFES